MENYLRDIQDIKKMMDRSSQFLSLSGLAGVMAGIYALIGAYFVNRLYDFNYGHYITLESTSFKLMIAIAGAVLVFSVVTA